MNKIRVIDLLNKIANGEEVPKKIRISVYEFEYDKELNTYFNINKASPTKSLIQDWLHNPLRLNIEVEIIEESEQEIDIQAIEELDIINIGNKPKYKNDLGEYSVRIIDIDMMCKINELIRAVKELDNKIKEK